MEFSRTTNARLIRSFLTDPRCYRRMRNDEAPPVDQFTHELPAGITYVVGVEAGAIAEVLFLMCDSKQGPTVAEVHFCFAPEAWGRTVEIAQGFLAWVWRETSLTRLVGKVPSYNRLARKVAKSCGFSQYGISLNAGTKDGNLFQLYLMELRRPN